MPLLKCPMCPHNVLSLSWSSWRNAKSLDNGIYLVRQVLGDGWAFQGAEDGGAVAYGDKDATAPVAEVKNFGSDQEPQWRYRIRD